MIFEILISRLVAWDNNQPVYEDLRVNDYLMNTCFGAERKSFNSFVFFSIDNSGQVTKVKVDEGASRYNQSRVTDATYRSIQEFKDKLHVCQ